MKGIIDFFKKNKMARQALITAAIFSLLLFPRLFISQIQNSVNKEMKYSEAVTCIENREVKELIANLESSRVDIVFQDDTQKFVYVPNSDEFWKYVDRQIELGNTIEISAKKGISNTEFSLFTSIITIMFLFIFPRYALKKIKNGGKNFEVKAVTTNVRFSDVAGIDEEREQLAEVVNFLKHPENYTSMGARIPKGILLFGAPGTGKTLLAKAIAGEAGVPFFQVTGSNFDEEFVGVGASRVREIFEKAKEVAPSIIFIDEIDSVAQNRYHYNSKSNSEQTLNQLLAEMDGFDSNNHVIVVAATNHKEILDPAILRPGRFDRHVHIPMPDVKARKEILLVHAKNKKFSSTVNLNELAKKTVGFSGASLENVLNEAALLTVKTGSVYITNPILDEAIARVIVGIKKDSTLLSSEEKYLTAIHEAGHAIVSAAIRPEIKNFCISIVPRGEAGGYNFFDESYRNYRQKKDIEKQIRVMYGGRCAEEILLGDISDGAASDLEKATDLVYQMVLNYAMSESKMVKLPNRPDFNDCIESEAIEKIEEICNSAYKETSRIVKKNQEVISKLAALLMDKEYLSDIEVSAFLSENCITQ